LIPHRARDDLRRVGAVAVLVGDVANLLEQAFGERRGVKSERDEAVAADVELVLQASLRGFGKCAIFTPVSLAISSASSLTR